MVTSRNLVSVRLLDAIGVNYARRFIQQFGFPAQSLPEDLSLALGTSSVPPLQLARGYAVFANGGFLIDPWYIEWIEDRDGITIRTEEHTSELQSLMRISYAVFCLNNKKS